MNETPLSQVSPDSLTDLFNKSPDTLTDADLDKMVTAFRAERARWNQQEVKKKAEKKAAPTALSLEDLEL